MVVCIHVLKAQYASTHSRKHTYTQSRHTHTYTQTNNHSHTHTRARTHTHTHAYTNMLTAGSPVRLDRTFHPFQGP